MEALREEKEGRNQEMKGGLKRSVRLLGLIVCVGTKEGGTGEGRHGGGTRRWRNSARERRKEG